MNAKFTVHRLFGRVKKDPLLLVMACITVLSACSSTVAPEQNYYVLQSDSQTNITEISGQPRVSIRRVKLPQYLNQQGIAKRLSNGQVSVSYIDLWAEKLSQAIPTLLAENMAAQLQSPVEINPLPPGIDVETLVEVNITRFIANDTALSLQANYRLIKPKQLQSHNFSTMIALSDDTTTTLVNGYSVAIKQLAEALAKKL